LQHRAPLAGTPAAPRSKSVDRAARARTTSAKLSYREQRELDELPARIEALETEQRTLAAAIGDPDFYRQPAALINAALERTHTIERELLDLYARWDALDSRSPTSRAD
jgi:ATP-binding cassette subfamily F protein uup